MSVPMRQNRRFPSTLTFQRKLGILMYSLSYATTKLWLNFISQDNAIGLPSYPVLELSLLNSILKKVVYDKPSINLRELYVNVSFDREHQ